MLDFIKDWFWQRGYVGNQPKYQHLDPLAESIYEEGIFWVVTDYTLELVVLVCLLLYVIGVERSTKWAGTTVCIFVLFQVLKLCLA